MAEPTTTTEHATTQRATTQRSKNEQARTGLSRRHLIGGAAGVGAVPLLVACGSDDTATDQPSTPAGDTPTPVTPSPEEPTAPSGDGTPAGSGLVATTDVPVGGGVVLGKDDVVVVQPEAGTFLGWSATCTHMGCTVGSVSDGVIQCPCHGSEYSIEDGSVSRGPATKGLSKVALVVKGNEVDKA